jgi:hypothetical protein
MSDNTLIYRAAVFLYPKLKWRWFEKYWETKPEWITAARKAIGELWSEYKATAPAATDASTLLDDDDDDEWSPDDQTSTVDQLWLYENEPHPKEMLQKDSLDSNPILD